MAVLGAENFKLEPGSHTFGCYRVFFPSWSGGVPGMDATGNGWSGYSSEVQAAVSRDAVVMFSIRTGQNNAPQTFTNAQDSWTGGGSATGPVICPSNTDVTAAGGRETEINKVGEGMIKLALAGKRAWYCMDHEADRWCSENPKRANKGTLPQFAVAFAHIVYRMKRRISSETVAYLGRSLTTAEKALCAANLKYIPVIASGGCRRLDAYKPAGVTLGSRANDMFRQGSIDLFDDGYCDHLGYDLYSIDSGGGFKTGNAAISVEDHFEGNFSQQNGNVAQHQAGSPAQLCRDYGIDFSIWEHGCQRGNSDGANGTFQQQADWHSAGENYMRVKMSGTPGEPKVLALTDFFTTTDDWIFRTPSNSEALPSGAWSGLSGNAQATWNDWWLAASQRAFWQSLDVVTPPPPPPARDEYWGMLGGSAATATETATTDWGQSAGGFAYESDLGGRKYGAIREYIGGWEGTTGYNPLRALPTSGAFTGGSGAIANQRARYAKAIADGTRMCLSLRSGTNDVASPASDLVQDSYCGNGDIVTGRQACSGKKILNGFDPVNGTGDRDGADINYLADMLANLTAQGGIWDFSLDHEIDLWVDRGAYVGLGSSARYSHADKGPPQDYAPAYAHVILKLKARWAAQHTATVISDATYNKLLGTTLTDGTEGAAIAGKPFCRFTTCFAFPAFNYLMTPDLWVGHGIDLGDYLDYIGADIYSEKANRGFATGDLALPFVDDFTGNYAEGGRTVAQHKAASLNQLCIDTGLPYGVWEAGCQRGNTSALYQWQADYMQGAVDFMVGQTQGSPHCEVWTGYYATITDDWPYPTPSVRQLGGTTISARDGNDALVGTGAAWNTLNAKSQAMWDVINAMANRPYFGGA